MACPVYLYSEFELMAVEINYVVPDGALTKKLHP